MKTIDRKTQLLFAALLILLGILFRTAWHLAPNVEFVTTATLLAAAYLGKKWALSVPLIIMGISDIFIGNTNIFLFTWSAYLIIGIMSNWLLGTKKLKLKMQDDKAKFKMIKIIKATSLGIAASILFYLWTNFGVWVLDAWGMYPKTLSGLIDAYILGIPFVKYNIIGNMLFMPISFSLVEFYQYYKLNILNKKVSTLNNYESGK